MQSPAHNNFIHKVLFKIRMHRLLKKLTQSEFAKHIGLSHRSYQRLENNSTALDLEVLLRISDVIDVPAVDLISGNNNQAPDFIKEINKNDFWNNEVIKLAKLKQLYRLINSNHLGRYLKKTIMNEKLFMDNDFAIQITDFQFKYSNSKFRSNSTNSANFTTSPDSKSIGTTGSKNSRPDKFSISHDEIEKNLILWEYISQFDEVFYSSPSTKSNSDSLNFAIRVNQNTWINITVCPD